MWQAVIRLPGPVRGVRLVPMGPAGPAAAPERPTAPPPASPPPPGPPVAEAAAPPEDHLVPLLEAVLQAVAALEARRRDSLAELQQAVIELAVAIASQLTYRIIEAGEFAVEKMVEDAVSRLPVAEHVTIRLHPQDLALFHERLKSVPAAALDARLLTLAADPQVPRGGCLAELPEQGILCDLELLLGDLHTELMEGLSDAQVERRRAQGADRGLRRFPDRRETA